uniref:Niemann-Pick C1 protein n=1 Tax=Rhipicephalus appendiculatus TaxID=34631 RepID=A0A131YGA9_RHIAP
MAVFRNKIEGKCRPSAIETIYVVERSFAEHVYDACKDVRTRLLGIKLMTLMCGKYSARKCTAQRFFDFVGAVKAEGGHSPLKIRHVLAETSIMVNGQKLEPFKANIL